MILMREMWADILVIFVTGGIVLTLGILSWRGRLRRNGLAGIRVGSLLSSDGAWKAGHRAAAPLLSACGGLGVVAALGLTLATGASANGDIPASALLYCYLIVLVLTLVIATVIALRAANAFLRVNLQPSSASRRSGA